MGYMRYTLSRTIDSTKKISENLNNMGILCEEHQEKILKKAQKEAEQLLNTLLELKK